MYLVSKRNTEELIPLIKRYVMQDQSFFRMGGGHIQEGYEHFMAEHKHKFKPIYTNADSGKKGTTLWYKKNTSKHINIYTFL